MRKIVFMAMNWVMSFIGIFSFTEKLYRTSYRAVKWSVEKLSGMMPLAIPLVEWKIVERLCSMKDKQSLNVYGLNPCSTGSLSSPMLS